MVLQKPKVGYNKLLHSTSADGTSADGTSAKETSSEGTSVILPIIEDVDTELDKEELDRVLDHSWYSQGYPEYLFIVSIFCTIYLGEGGGSATSLKYLRIGYVW